MALSQRAALEALKGTYRDAHYSRASSRQLCLMSCMTRPYYLRLMPKWEAPKEPRWASPLKADPEPDPWVGGLEMEKGER